MTAIAHGGPTDRKRTTPWLTYAIGAGVFVLAAVTRADADLWGHLRFGLDILRDRTLVSIDPYSFTQDKPWVNHEWLSELSMAVAYRVGGTTGLVLMKAAMLTTVWAIVWRGLAGVSHAVRFWVLVGLVFGTIHMTSSMRPQLWTLLAIAILCRVLVGGRPRSRWWLPPLFAVWVNCHGGWIVGVGVLGVWAAADTFSRPFHWRQWTTLLCATLIATLFNPYGWGLWAFLSQTVRMERNIMEWGPLWGTPVLNWIPWIACTAGVFWSLRRPRSDRWAVTAVLLMLSYASLRVMRIESIFVTAAAILLGPALGARWPSRSTPLSSFVRANQSVFAVAVFGLLVWGCLHTRLAAFTCIGVWSAQRPDQEAAPFLARAQRGRLVTFFDWGQYAIWHFAPRLRVSMDGRRETVYSDRRLEEHGAILDGTSAGVAVLADWRAEYVWLPITSVTTERWLRENGYRVDVETRRSFVAVRADLPSLAAVPGRQGVTPRPCFPG